MDGVEYAAYTVTDYVQLSLGDILLLQLKQTLPLIRVLGKGRYAHPPPKDTVLLELPPRSHARGRVE